MNKVVEFIKYAIKCYIEINARNPYFHEEDPQ